MSKAFQFKTLNEIFASDHDHLLKPADTSADTYEAQRLRILWDLPTDRMMALRDALGYETGDGPLPRTLTGDATLAAHAKATAPHGGGARIS